MTFQIPLHAKPENPKGACWISQTEDLFYDMSIPVNIPSIPENAENYVTAAIRQNWISSLCKDPKVNFLGKLENELARWIGVPYATAVTSGTTALHLALSALDLKPGDEVIVPDFTMIATVSGIVHLGARPVFIDADPRTWCIDPERIERRITSKTRGIIPVHIFGHPCRMDRILKIARDHHLWVIEDAAQALGTEYAGKRAGSFGDMACFSFYANKLVTSGEGGMVVTRKKSLLKKITLLKNHCLTRKRFYHEDLGYNFRMSNLSAAYAYASFREISRNLRIKLEHARLYRSLLSNVPGLTLPPENGPREKSAYWMFGILVNPSRFGLTKNRLRKQLKIKYDIETRDFFCPMHRQPALIKRGLIAPGEEFPVSDSIYQNGLYLPSGLVLSGDQIKAVTGAVRRIHKMKGLKC